MMIFPRTLENCSECGAPLGKKHLIFTPADEPPNAIYPCVDCERKFTTQPKENTNE